MPFDNPHEAPVGDLEILFDARARISRTELWVKGRFRDGDRHCLVAALSRACFSRGFKFSKKTERRLCLLIARQLKPVSPWWMRIRLFTARDRLVLFNDDPLTTHGDVLALLDRTISHLASRVPEYVPA
jgi:hypothetical protein